MSLHLPRRNADEYTSRPAAVPLRNISMIGQLILPEASHGGVSHLRAQLRDDLTWHCDDEQWELLLNTRFPGPIATPGDASAGRFLLYRAAERLSARVVLAEASRNAVLQPG
jgi:hypothetical protein